MTSETNHIERELLQRWGKARPEAAGLWDVGAADYHACLDRDSHSSIETYRASDLLYHARYVERSIAGREATEDMRFGSAFDCWLLENETFSERYVALPEGHDGRTKAGKGLNAEIRATGKETVPAEWISRFQGMFSGLARNRFAQAALINDGPAQVAMRWTCPETGLPLKAMLDKVLISRQVIVDLKTTANPLPEEFGRIASRFGYHRQAAMYIDAARHSLGLEADFVFVALQREPPFEAVVYTVNSTETPELLDLARRQNLATLRDIAELKAKGPHWTGKTQGQVFPLPLPRWAWE